MKDVLISIQPKWCELIASGKKTVEVRKTKPKIDTPFKCYIYCTLSGSNEFFKEDCNSDIAEWNKSKMALKKGKVIGEFVCDRAEYVRNYGDMVDSYDCIASCLSAHEIIEYAKDKNGNFVYTYGWHISDLVIYDKPKELSEFYTLCYSGCSNCDYLSESYSYAGGRELFCTVSNKKPIIRPPQSWCYVEQI